MIDLYNIRQRTEQKARALEDSAKVDVNCPEYLFSTADSFVDLASTVWLIKQVEKLEDLIQMVLNTQTLPEPIRDLLEGAIES